MSGMSRGGLHHSVAIGEIEPRSLVVPHDTDFILEHGVNTLADLGFSLKFGEEAMLPRDLGDLRNGMLIWSAGMLLAAHPVISDALVTQSRLSEDSGNIWERFISSTEKISQIVNSDNAIGAGRAVRDIHRNISGTDSDGTRKSAMHHEPYSWGWVSIMWMTEQTRKRFGKTERSPERWEQWWNEARVAYQAQGVSDRLMPPTYADYQAYVTSQMRDRLERTEATDIAREQVETGQIDRPPQVPPRLWRKTFRHVLSNEVKLVTAGGLPDVMRDKLGFEWSETDEQHLRTIDAAIRRTWPAVPKRLRYEHQAAAHLYPAKRRHHRAELHANRWFTGLHFTGRER